MRVANAGPGGSRAFLFFGCWVGVRYINVFNVLYISLMSGKVLRAYIRELLNEYDIIGKGDSKIKLGAGGLPPIFIEPGPERGPDDESYRTMIKEFAFRIYQGIYGGHQPILVKGYNPKSGEDPSKPEVQRALEHAAEYTGEAIDFYRRKRLVVNAMSDKLYALLSERVSELESNASQIEEKMKIAIAAGKGAVGKRKLAELKGKIREFKNIMGNLRNGYQDPVNIAKYVKKHYDLDFEIDEKALQEYNGIGSSEGFKWAHDIEYVWSLREKPAKLRDQLIKTGKMPNGHVITNDIIKAFKKYGDVGLYESYKEGNLYDLRNKTQIQDPEDFIKPEPGARRIHNSDAYEFAIAIRQNKAEQEYYDNHMADRMRRHRGGI